MRPEDERHVLDAMEPVFPCHEETHDHHRSGLSLASLPPEVCFYIFQYLNFVQLLALSGTCRQLHFVCQRDLRRLRIECDRICANITDRLHPWPWHRLLIRILNGDMPPQAVKEANIGNSLPRNARIETSRYPRMGDNGELIFDRKVKLPAEEPPDPHIFDGVRDWTELTRRASAASPWLPSKQHARVQIMIELGSVNAVAAVLLPLLPNLQALGPPRSGAITSGVVNRLAHAQQMQELHQSSPDDEQRSENLRLLPLSRVTTLEFSAPARDAVLGILSPFVFYECAGLQSLKRIIVESVHELNLYGWHPGCVRPVCPEVLVHGPRRFHGPFVIAWGWAVPCVIRQVWAPSMGVQLPKEMHLDVLRFGGDLCKEDRSKSVIASPTTDQDQYFYQLSGDIGSFF